MKLILTEEQKEDLEETFGTHEELQRGVAYNLTAQVLTGEDEWVLEVAEIRGDEAEAMYRLVDGFMHRDEDPADVIRAIGLLHAIEDFADYLDKCNGSDE